MVAEARANYPKLTFQVGDAENLPYADGTFDYAACGFGHLHFGDADQALSKKLTAYWYLAGGMHSPSGAARIEAGKCSS